MEALDMVERDDPQTLRNSAVKDPSPDLTLALNIASIVLLLLRVT